MKTQYPQLGGMPEREIVLSYLIWGVLTALMESKYEETMTHNSLADAVREIIHQLDEQDPAISDLVSPKI